MQFNNFDRQRLINLEEVLEIEYEKLGVFEREIVITASAQQKFELTQRIKRDLIPSIRQHQTEYTEIICQDLESTVITEIDAINVLDQVYLIVQKLQNHQLINQQDKLIEMLTNIQNKLDDPGKAATAKLKIALPIIPALASYEMDLDTEAFIVKIWEKINHSLRRFWK